MKKIFFLFSLAVLFTLAGCKSKKEVQVDVGFIAPVWHSNKTVTKPVTASYNFTEPASGTSLYVLIMPSAAEVLDGSKPQYPLKDTSWYEGSTFFQIKNGVVM